MSVISLQDDFIRDVKLGEKTQMMLREGHKIVTTFVQ